VRDKAGHWVPQARIEVVQDDRLLGTAVANERGEVTVPLRPGQYTVDVTALGIDLHADYPVQVFDAEQQSESILLPDYQPGRVVAKITDVQGHPLPCKVSFTAKDGAPQPTFGPETAEFGVNNLRYAPLGEFEQDLPPGEYDVVISHGPEYDAVVTEIVVEPGQRRRLEHKLVRSVDTTGWISSDFHSHSTPSGDNTSSQLGRVLTDPRLAPPVKALFVYNSNPAAVAPEQERGEVDALDARSDVYALGAVLYFLLALKTPPGGGPPPPAAGVPPPLLAVCAKAMAVEKHDRYSDAVALDAEIARWEKRAAADGDARAVLRAFLGLRELLWEVGVRPRPEPAAPPAARGRKAGPDRPQGRVQRVHVEG